MIHQLNSMENGLDLYYQTPLIKAITFFFALILQTTYFRKGVRTSGILFVFWSLMTFQVVLSCWTTIVTLQNPEDKYWTISKMTLICQSIETLTIISYLIAICFADKQRGKYNEDPKKICPFTESSFFSQMFFSWYDSMAYLGYKKSLTLDDMWNLPKVNRSREIFAKFRHNLNSSKNCIQTSESPQKNNTNDSLALQPLKKVQSAPKSDYSVLYNPKFDILTTLIGGFWFHLVACSVLKLISSFLTFANPSLLDQLLTFVKSSDPAWQGYLIAVAMFAFSLLQSLIDGQYEFWISNLGLRMKSAMVSTIYQKSLKLSSQGRKAFTTGEIVNLMGVDTNRVFMFINQYNFMLSFPVQLGMSLKLLWNQLGVSSVGGLIFMLLLIPFNAWSAMKMKNIQQNVMKQKDRRTKTMNEILSGMKVLKLYAWELAFGDFIKEARAAEIKALKTQAIFGACTSFLFFSAPFFVALISFATFVLTDPSHVLDANKAFVSLTLFNILSQSLTMLPRVITTGANCWVSIKRINKYLQGEEIDLSQVNHDGDTNFPVSLSSASFTWSATDSPVLRDIDCSIPKGSLVAIVGPIGSGKSSLLSALLGDLFKISGEVNLTGSLAYVPQTAWIQNETLKRNIIFGQPLNQSKYDKVIEACALTPDLKILPGGDSTEIGERGINLSGGQKQRVSLARSVYADSDIYLMDDPLSAVDAHVAKHLFTHVIGPKGILKDKTRILVTHRLTFLPQVDEIIVLKDGGIQEKGTYSELISKKGEFADFVVQYLTESELDGEEEVDDEDQQVLEKIKESVKPELEKRLSQAISESSEGDGSKPGRRRTLTSSLSKRSIISNGFDKSDENKDKKSKKDLVVQGKEIPPGGGIDRSKLIVREKAAVGSVKGSVYIDYLRAVGFGMCGIIVACFGLSQLLTVSRNLWLTAWADDSLDSANLNDTHLRNLRLGIYAGIGGLETIFTMANSLLLNVAVLTGSKLIHDRMLDRIIRAPMSFYDTTPLGRILNRFSGDIDTCDSTIGFNLRMLISLAFRGTVSIVVICLETPYFLVVIIVMTGIYSLIQMFYIASSRQLRRIESSSRSPVFSHFSETITGSSTIRAYNAEQRFFDDCFNRVDKNQSCSFANMAAGRWLSIRLQFLGNLIVFTSAVFAVSSRSRLSPGLTGLFVSYASQITGILNMLVRSVTDVEINIVAVERCLEYTKTEQEAPDIIESNRPQPNWPDKGEVIFRDYNTRYRDDLDPVLVNISLTINPNEKIGIVGRTGAGKSSLTLAVFRLIESISGQIIIDNMDISKLGLHDLRSRITVIPQDPVLFSGNFRRNFDPLEQHTDVEIWNALEQAHLKKFVSSLETGLDYEIVEGGENLSVGQRQLVCLTRALLRKTKILVLDEATAAVDVETDELIQKTIRTEFADCTIITIAHRLNTIMDYDRILVLDQGKIKEFDSPSNLLANDKSVFYSMVKESNLLNQQTTG
ncbi:ATP-binding cassette sub-family C member 3-like isoform X2 [Panonychus citri]|nr:ATP-binding cassette sub-family C member 3-like isoform X2 [Panonychus citri]